MPMTLPPAFDGPDDQQPDARQLLLLNAATLALTHAASLPALFETLAAHIGSLFSFDHASLTYHDGRDWQLALLGGLDSVQTPETCPAIQQALATHEPVIRQNGDGQTTASAFESLVVLPLLDDGRMLGTLQLAHRQPNAFAPADVELASLLAAHVAAALVSAARLEDAQAQIDALALLNQELDAYDYSAAHDLKAPLNIINNYAFLLQDALKDGNLEEAASFGVEISQTVRGRARLLDQLLLVTRAADETEVPPATPVRPVLEQVRAQFRQPLEQGGITLRIEGDLPQVIAYPVQLETIFSNLIGNAIKYIGATENPTITISSRADDSQAHFEVRDNGIGMTEAEQARLFRRFSRVGRNEAEGTGLGLAIARRTVERLGGTMGVTSAPGQGSAFAFSLPLAQRQD